jgi:hypothetical protein
MRLIDEFLTVFRNLVRQTVVTARNGLPLGSGAQQNISRNFRQEIATTAVVPPWNCGLLPPHGHEVGAGAPSLAPVQITVLAPLLTENGSAPRAQGGR